MPTRICLTHEDVFGVKLEWDQIATRLSRFPRDHLVPILSSCSAFLRDCLGRAASTDVDKTLVRSLGTARLIARIDEAVARLRPEQPVVFGSLQLLHLMYMALESCGDVGDRCLDVPQDSDEFLMLALAVNDHLVSPSAGIGRMYSEWLITPREQPPTEFARFICKVLPMAEVENVPPLSGLICHHHQMIETTASAGGLKNHVGHTDLVAWCKERHGLVPSDMLTLALAWNAPYLQTSGRFLAGQADALRHLNVNSIGRALPDLADKVNTFRAVTARCPRDIVERVNEKAADLDKRTNYSLEALRRYPLVDLGNDRLVPAFPPFLVDRVTRGVLEEFVEAHPSSPGGRDHVGDFLGELYHAHMRAYFVDAKKREAQSPGCLVLPDPGFVGHRPESLGDAVIYEPPNLIVFEFKAHTLKERSRYSPTANTIVNDMSSEILQIKDGTSQIGRAVSRFLARERTLPGLAPDAVEAVYPVLVCLDNAYSCIGMNVLADVLVSQTSRARQTRSPTIMMPWDVSSMVPHWPGIRFSTALTQYAGTALAEPFHNLLWTSLLDPNAPRRMIPRDDAFFHATMRPVTGPS